MTTPIDQLAIMLTGVISAWALNSPSIRARRWGCIIGLLGQPFWLWSTVTNGQWGMACVTVGYTAAFLRGIWLLWIRPRIQSLGVLLNPHALWIGAHYSPANRRWCINILPGATVWLTLPGGKAPDKAKL